MYKSIEIAKLLIRVVNCVLNLFVHITNPKTFDNSKTYNGTHVRSMDEAHMAELRLTVESNDFSCFLCINLLSQHAGNVGLLHYLIKKLATFSYSEIEFYIPQLIQILISFETNSMALPDFILEQSRKSPHFCLIAFWNLQAYVSELKSEPDSYSFHVVRNFINSLQDIMFNQNSMDDSDINFRENLHPALVLCASITSSMAIPNIHDYIKPLVISQGRQQKSFLFKLANFHKALTKNLTLKNSRRPLDLASSGPQSGDDDETDHDEVIIEPKRYSESILSSSRYSRASMSPSIESDTDVHYASDYAGDQKNIKNYNMHSKRVIPKRSISSMSTRNSLESTNQTRSEYLSSHSMPDLTRKEKPQLIDQISSLISGESKNSINNLGHKTSKLSILEDDNSKLLRVNYFKKETEFMMVLQNISLRLSQVPKEARLTSLRAELSIINRMLLPSLIDIPQLLPSSSMPNRRYHRILKLNVNEACVLNSAERVPYLLLIEYLNEDMDFDPSTEKNKEILISEASRLTTPLGSPRVKLVESPVASNFNEEADLGDMSVVALSNQQTHFLSQLQARMTKEMKPQVDTEVVKSKKVEEGAESKPSTKAAGHTHKDLSTQIRIASVMLKQLEKSGRANSDQSEAIKARIIKSMKALQNEFETIDYEQIKELSAAHSWQEEQDAGERKVENDFKIGEDWATKRARIRKTSAYGHLPNWDLCSVIVKNGDDLQQEAFACQLISVISTIWRNSGVGVWTKNMKIVVTSSHSGLVQTINNALSVHSIKKTMTEISIQNGNNPKGFVASIKDYFLKIYGEESSSKFKRAQENFARSLAAYSIICYVLQIKDRHNGNIMLDHEGHIIHIDFGFILSNSPGSVGFEAAPFKLSLEYVDVLGGIDSYHFKLFTQLCKNAFLSLRKSCNNLIDLVDLMQKDSSLPCFKSGVQTKALLRQRLQLDLSDEECEDFVETTLIGKSMGSMYTRLYDQFQLLTQGIYS